MADANVVELLRDYVNTLRNQGKIGFQTLRSLNQVLKYKDQVLDRRYIKCVLFPEYSKGARIPSPHTLATGIWKIVTEYTFEVPATKNDYAFIIDLEIGAKNAPFIYMFEVDRSGFFSQNPVSIINGSGLGVTFEEGKAPFGQRSVYDMASIDPISLYPRYRLVGASCTIIPVQIRNSQAEVLIAQTDDFPLKLVPEVNVATEAVTAQSIIDFILAPTTFILGLSEVNLRGPVYSVGKEPSTKTTAQPAAELLAPILAAPHEGGGTATIADIFAHEADNLINPLYAVQEDKTWTDWFFRRSKRNTTYVSGYKNTDAQRNAYSKIVTNCGLIPAFIGAFNPLCNYLESEKYQDYDYYKEDKITALKAFDLSVFIAKFQNFCGNSDIFEIIAALVRAIFPELLRPAAKPRRQMSRAKIMESAYQIKGSMGVGCRMVYLPRSTNALKFREIEDVLEDENKDIFWGVTTNLSAQDQFKIIVTRHLEGVPYPALQDYLPLARSVPDSRTLEVLDRISSLSPDLLVVPPHELFATYTRVKGELGLLVVPGTTDNADSKTDKALRSQLNYDLELGGGDEAQA